MMYSENLLPYQFKKISFVFFSVGICCIYAYFKGIKPEFLNVPIFALASTYMENRYFQMVRTNLMDEMGFVSLLLGVFFMAFSKEKNEKIEFDSFRLKSFLLTARVTFLLWIVCYLLFFGFIIFPISMAIFLFFSFIYYIYFKYLIHSYINN